MRITRPKTGPNPDEITDRFLVQATKQRCPKKVHGSFTSLLLLKLFSKLTGYLEISASASRHQHRHWEILKRLFEFLEVPVY